jgi:putative ABC transport system permease protein
MMRAIYTGFLLAFRALSRNVLRAGLTVLGILIGVAAVVTVTALGSGARESVTSQIQALGSNIFMIAGQNSGTGARAQSGTLYKLSEEDARAIQREAVSVKAVAPALRARAQVAYMERNWSTSVVGTMRAFIEVRSWPVARGAMWTEQDETTKTKVAVIGTTVQKKLFGDEDPIGRMIRIGRYPFRVVGVLQSKGEAPFGGDQDDQVLMPIGSMRARVMRTPPGMVGVMLCSATSSDTTDRAVKQVEGILRQRHRIPEDREPDFWIRTQKEFEEMQTAIYQLLTILLVLLAGISLIVGGIGVMNIMLVSVTERTREIGIRMAIGAREGDIRTQFLVEAVVLAAIGGVTGATVGLAAIWALRETFDWPMSLSPVALAMSLASSALTGVVFGFFPARRAARLDPIEALRHE